jgi:hypothetical protein
MSTQTKVQNRKSKLLSINVGKATLAQLESLKFLEMSENMQDISTFISWKFPTDSKTHPHFPSDNGKVKAQTGDYTYTQLFRVHILPSLIIRKHHRLLNCNITKPNITNSVALVCKRTLPTERPPLVSEVGANFCG